MSRLHTGSSARRGGVRRSITALMLVVATRQARANDDSESKKILAQALFDQARSAMLNDDYGVACKKLAASSSLDAAPGTLLNLALCHELQGKIATAWSEYNDLLTLAAKRQDTERQQIASDRIRELTPKLSYLLVEVRDPGLPDLTIALDGVALAPGAWGTPLPVDPGAHQVTARATDRQKFSVSVRVGTTVGRHTVRVSLPLLERAPQKQGAEHASWLSCERKVGVAALGVGIAALGAGTYFGLRARESWAEREAHCGDGSCDDSAVSAYRDAKRFAAFADVSFALGLPLTGAGIYLLLTSERSVPTRAGNRNAPGTREYFLLEVGGAL